VDGVDHGAKYSIELVDVALYGSSDLFMRDSFTVPLALAAAAPAVVFSAGSRSIERLG
jgi:hypothetical protein